LVVQADDVVSAMLPVDTPVPADESKYQLVFVLLLQLRASVKLNLSRTLYAQGSLTRARAAVVMCLSLLDRLAGVEQTKALVKLAPHLRKLRTDAVVFHVKIPLQQQQQQQQQELDSQDGPEDVNEEIKQHILALQSASAELAACQDGNEVYDRAVLKFVEFEVMQSVADASSASTAAAASALLVEAQTLMRQAVMLDQHNNDYWFGLALCSVDPVKHQQ
jgi:hypothetical protein